MQFVVLKQHLLGDMVLVNLIRLDVRILDLVALIRSVLLPDDLSPGVQHLQVVLNGLLYSNIRLGEHVTGCLAYITN